MASTICGPQYTGKGCECRAQVTPGVTPSTGEASNPTWICAHVQDGIQVGCDPGCCPTDCSAAAAAAAAATTASSGDTKGKYWWIILVSILFGLMMFVSYFYRSTRRSNSGIPYTVISLTVAALIAIVVTTIVMLTKK